MNKVKRFFSLCYRKTGQFITWYKNLYKGRPWYTKAITAIVSMIVLLFLYLGAVDINFLWLFGKSPGYFSGIRDPQTSQASEIYSADGVLIGKFFNENRTPVKYDEVSKDFWRALIDTEDERFYSHMGVDPIGIFGAVKDALLHHDGRGASTITQQLAKNMFRVRSQYSTGLLGKVPGLKILIVKSKEWIIATKLETIFTKEEIITMYANTVDFGSNAFGIKTAAKTYFNTTPKDLTTEQAAVLVGMLKATTYYNPLANPENSLRRRNVVLQNMVTHNDLTQERCDSLMQLPIKLEYKVENNYDGKALYFRQAVADYLKSWCMENNYDLYSSGLKIYTTIDTRMQKYAEDAAIKQMRQVQRNFRNHWGNNDPWIDETGKVIPNFIEDIAKRQPFYKSLLAMFPNEPDSINYYLNKPHKVKLFDYENGTIEMEMSSLDSIRYMVKFMHCAMIAMEPQTGAVKAWVGDIDYKSWKYDKVTAMRQPGSTFKLFVYTEAMNQGLTPCDKRRDEYISMQVYDAKKHEMTTWTPGNANGTFSGDSMPLKSAFAKSINSVAVRLGQEMGIKRIIDTAHKMGIKSRLDDAPALALGSSDVNLLELANSYCTISNNGKHHEPVLVTRIVDKDGNEVYRGPETEEQAISYKSAFLMQQLLKGGMLEPGGTSQSLWGYVGNFKDTEFGGKTGTSNNHSDAWFMCVSPKLVVGAWVGGEYRSIHFRTGALGQGSRTALPICGYFLESVLSDPAFAQYRAKFDKPNDDNITSDMYTCQSYYHSAVADTTETDSAIVTTEEIILDENGNPIARPVRQEPAQDAQQGGGEQKSENKSQRKEQVVNFDDL
ncbi:transglycosylase domain-containing protein [Prevotella sp. P3-122]|uniref:transglycosylase domain-containing protein n=1 Tax=Prevotella sp. P3-122 TaxID=2024223 RepID=UPI000B972C6B|nr:transglycosylase domain-containing protein [Prevotella sp. P3-122]OYP63444.1 transglycosylase [Prevotella sp. P3-122]